MGGPLIAMNRSRGLGGQASVEFTAVALVFFFTLFFVIWAGLAMFERSSVVSHLGTLGSELPSGWQQMNASDLVLDLLTSDGVLKKENIEIVDVKLDAQTGTPRVDEPNDVAKELGGSKNTVVTSTLKVWAKVRYTYSPPLPFGGTATLNATVTRTYMIGQLNEYS